MQDAREYRSAFQPAARQGVHRQEHESARILGRRGDLLARRSERMHFSPEHLRTHHNLLHEQCVSGKTSRKYLHDYRMLLQL